MKNLILAACFFLFASVSFAQNVTISIVGLNDKDPKAETVFQVESAELINNIDIKTNQLANQRIVVNKEGYDEISSIIKNAATTGKMASSATITFKNGSESVKVNLSSVLLTNYSWKMEEGEPFTESFEIAFRIIN